MSLQDAAETPTFSVLYNNCRGYWQPSNKAMERYNELKRQIDCNYNDIDTLCYADRDDPILIRVFEELGQEFDEKDDRCPSKTKIAKIAEKYRDFYTICEDMNGREWIETDYEKYKVYEFKAKLLQILDKDISDEKKLQELSGYIRENS